VRAVELERRQRDGSVENRGVIAFRIKSFDLLLLVEPEKKSGPAGRSLPEERCA